MASEETTNPNAGKVVVLDITYEDTPEVATARLGEQYDNGFHIHRAIEWPGGMRVIFVQSAKPAAKPAKMPDVAQVVKTKELTKRRFGGLANLNR